MRPSDTFTNTPPDVAAEAARRRTFAVISHPDAGKSTLTEALALHARVLAEAGTVHGRAGRKGVVSDWMEMERRRGISITAAALQFEYRETVINLLDTPGHADFSEDTYRVLAAVDSAVMLLDAARGVEAQTRKLFAVCRHRGIPIVTFVNKWDRPGKEPLALLDEIETVTGMRPTPLTWPVGIAGDFRGAVDRRTGSYLRMSRSAGGATLATEEEVAAERAAAEEGDAWGTATDELALLDSVGADLDVAGYHAQQSTPVLFGAALSNLGVHHLLDTLLDLAPAPPARVEEDGGARSVEAPFSGQVFKVQTGMDPAHRDRVAFLRVCSGRFDRGMVTTHAETGRPFATKYTQAMFGQERNLLETAYPGDIVGLVNATALGVGDTLYAGNRTSFPALPKFAPEHFAVVTAADAGRYKQFRRGVVQLDAEGVVQVLRSEIRGEQAPVLAAVGPMQFDVAVHRLQNEFGVAVRLERLNYQTVRRTTHASTPRLQRHAGVEVFTRSDGEQLALFRDRFRLATIQEGDDEIHLEPLVAVAVAD